jgi:hypothetical protein
VLGEAHLPDFERNLLVNPLETGIIPQHPGCSGTPGHVDLNRERMIVVKKLIALLLLVGLLTTTLGCTGTPATTPSSPKTSIGGAPTGGGAPSGGGAKT